MILNKVLIAVSLFACSFASAENSWYDQCGNGSTACQGSMADRARAADQKASQQQWNQQQSYGETKSNDTTGTYNNGYPSSSVDNSSRYSGAKTIQK